MTKEAFPQIDSGSASTDAFEAWHSDAVSDDIPTTEHGIVLLPGLIPCEGAACHHRGGHDECFLDRDHGHHSAVHYERDSSLAEEFRDLGVLKRWVHRCVHERKHQDYPGNVPVPARPVMHAVIREAGVVSALEANYRSAQGQQIIINHPDRTKYEREGAKRALEKLLQQRPHLIRSLDNIDFLPQEIITGALLLISPGEAQTRVYKNPRIVLPGTIRWNEVDKAWTTAETLLATREAWARASQAEAELDDEYAKAVARAA